MQLKQYNLTFSRLTKEDLELVRGWRNSGSINQWMIYRKNISSEEQLEWFNNLDSNTNYYFIVNHKQQRIGLMNIKDINWQDKTGEPGGFIIEQHYLGTLVPALCLLMMFDFAFYHLGLSELQGKVLETNSASLNCNLELGGIIASTENGICRIVHSKQNYQHASARYRDAARALYPESESQFYITA
jgi:RimJ/RimL family protein N-acetyltransferase